MGERRIGVIINGATGRMGTTQHMANLLAIAAEGGLPLANGDRLIPELMRFLSLPHPEEHRAAMRLEGWEPAPCLLPILRDAHLRCAPQDEVSVYIL